MCGGSPLCLISGYEVYFCVFIYVGEITKERRYFTLVLPSLIYEYVCGSCMYIRVGEITQERRLKV